MDVLVDVVRGDRATVADVVVKAEGHVVRVKRDAVRHPDDRPDDTVGGLLAVGRALEAAGRQLQRKGWRRVPKPDVGSGDVEVHIAFAGETEVHKLSDWLQEVKR